MKAKNELLRVKNLSAFNVNGYVKKQKINQFLVIYFFDDFSQLKIFAKKSKGLALQNDLFFESDLKINQ